MLCTAALSGSLTCKKGFKYSATHSYGEPHKEAEGAALRETQALGYYCSFKQLSFEMLPSSCRTASDDLGHEVVHERLQLLLVLGEALDALAQLVHRHLVLPVHLGKRVICARRHVDLRTCFGCHGIE